MSLVLANYYWKFKMDNIYKKYFISSLLFLLFLVFSLSCVSASTYVEVLMVFFKVLLSMIIFIWVLIKWLSLEELTSL
ncbi:hypothetical protein [Methanobrevibacter arboriphilus]|jgi:hypothetical protein|uniref:hypothetical protein n=1 Tax=Methanobrevibacter arboriphilus TaxID=39441 RepID=UPI000B237730|nr:hypothetical protein [Methanobrevibacter arboriphilus]